MPALGNYLVSIMKDVPVLSVVTVLEMLNVAKIIGDQTFDYLVPLSHGRRALPHPHAGRLGARALARRQPSQDRIAPQMSEPIIVFDKVVKRFGDHVVLDELDFTVAPGEKVTIIGPSGSGKSTVLRILMTLETINGGVISRRRRAAVARAQERRAGAGRRKRTCATCARSSAWCSSSSTCSRT